MKKILFVIFIISIIGFPLASAHPFTTSTVPAQSSNVPEGTTQVIIHYSEAVELQFSAIKVLDNTGKEVDNKDSKYYEGKDSLIVTTPPLTSGVYTVTSKVLSQVDGHLVDYAYVFAVGDIKIDPEQLGTPKSSDTIFLPEAGARFPGFVGETIVLGAVIASMLIWGTQKKDLIKNELEKFQVAYHGKFMSITGIGLILVFASNILILSAQSFRLETSALNALQTSFGMTWIFRMVVTVILLGVWFWLERNKVLSFKKQIPLLVLALVLIGTSTMVGHGFASEEYPPIILDYVHNLVAAIWIGGIIFFAFTLLPAFSSLSNDNKEKMTLVSIPRFSIAFVIAVGVVIITGPTLMWFLESDVSLITESTYGKLIFAKIAIASIMVAIGGYFQFKVQKDSERDLRSGKLVVHKKLQRSLKLDAFLGIALLGVVALLVNGTLPAGEIQKVDAQTINYGFNTILFSENAKFVVDVLPVAVGSNSITVVVSDLDNNPLSDLDGIKVKVSNPSRSIAPIEITMAQQGDMKNKFKGDLAFGFSGKWRIEVEAQRTQNSNELVMTDLLVKPRLVDLKTQVTEYDLPEKSQPLFPIYDGNGNIWISDPAGPRVWKFSIADKKFEKFEYDGQTSITLEIDRDGKVWFTDIPKSQIGFIDPNTKKVTLIPLPSIDPADQNSIAIALKADLDNNIWITITNKNVVLKYDQKSQKFEQIIPPTKDSGPFALAIDSSGKIWFSETIAGKIASINPKTNEIREFSPETPLQAPEALSFDKNGFLWIAEHTGLGITKFDPVLESFDKKAVPDKDALPFGIVFDRYGNVWFAQHTVDKLGVYDPDHDNLIEVPVPTASSFVQFTTTDSDENVWFVEQQGSKIGMVSITEIPTAAPITTQDGLSKIRYSEIVSPLIALGIIASALFFVKNVQEKRRLNELVLS